MKRAAHAPQQRRGDSGCTFKISNLWLRAFASPRGNRRPCLGLFGATHCAVPKAR